KVLEARFGPQIADDVAVSIIQQSYTDALQSHQLEPVGRPQAERGHVSRGADFSFTITAQVKPEVELRKYTDVEVVYPRVEASEDEVDQAVQNRFESQARLVEVDRAAEQGDMVLVELVAKEGEDEVASEPGTM